MPVKIVSEAQLRRLKKSGKVRKKMGAQPEKTMPTPVAAKGGERMSGSKPAEQPVLAPSVAPVAPEMPEVKAPKVESTASMSASIALRDGLLQNLIENNTQAIESFRLALTEQKPRVGVAYRHTVNRNKKSSLIDEVISTPIES
jgi:hypothetical protein